MNKSLEWKENIDPIEWDNLLASFNGHPLQSAQWGESRWAADKIKQVRWIAYQDNQPIYLVRFEERYIFKLLKIAWIPKSICINNVELSLQIQSELFKRFKC